MNIPSKQFISNFEFSYVETYSFQRGTEYDNNLNKWTSDFLRLKEIKEKQNNLTQIEYEEFNRLNKICGETQYLLDENGEFHFSSKKTNTFMFNDPIIDRFIKILKTEIVNLPMWMCAPIYRDAFVFFDKSSKIIQTLNICLSCEYMEISKGNHIDADFKTYELFNVFAIKRCE